ncbi:membrane dipeptidase [Blautia pseudococcoides]|uniref:dipeptidase n=1 Tax=Blautia pseudococcoides TaxID=1796616 RepID=UPI00148B27F2|nr:membrane dipeptidase [Blautia pseudococcoides]QJU16177.1 membrane dipeptidase [Blautia pseudococcoides]
MQIIDMHCDTISKIRRVEKEGSPASLRQNALSVDLEKMKKGGYTLQTFAIYVNWEEEPDAEAAAREILKIFRREMQQSADLISQIRTYRELEANERAGKMSALLSLEEGAIFQDSVDSLRWFQEQGVRMATLTWNYENDLGYPNCMGNPLTQEIWSWGDDRGLKEKGIRFLEELEHLHILVDVSHLSDGGFWDVAKHSTRPFLASHSNARGLAKASARNLTDDMIRTLAGRGGVMGLNYAVSFMRPAWKPGENGTTVEEIIEMADYITNVGGTECLGLGSDYDGILELPEISDCSRIQFLAEQMEKHGFTYSQTEKILGGNVRRFLKENLF